MRETSSSAVAVLSGVSLGSATIGLIEAYRWGFPPCPRLVARYF